MQKATIKDFRKQLSKDISIFAKIYFPDIFSLPFCKAHLDIFEHLNFRTGFDLLYFLPRSHGKSVIFSLLVPVYCICHNIKKYIVLFSSTQDNAFDLIQDIKEVFEENELIMQDFNIKPKLSKVNKQTTDWTKSKLTFSNGCRIIGVGRGKAIRGKRKGANRPDLLVFDDIQQDETVDTQEGRKKLEDWYTKTALMLRGYKGADTIFSGTAMHPEDLINTLFESMTKNKEGHCRKYPAVIDEKSEDVLWKEAFPYEELMRLKTKMGEIAFMQEMQHIPVTYTIQIFDVNKFSFFNANKERLEDFIFFGGIDLATGDAKDNGDYSSFIIIGVHKTNKKMYIFENYYTKNKTPLKFLFDIIPLILKYNLLKLAIEKNNFTTDIILMFREELAKRKYKLEIVDIINKENKKLRILSLERFIISERLLFRQDWENSYKELIDELRYFGAKGINDDCPDSLELGVRLAIRYCKERTGYYLNGI